MEIDVSRILEGTAFARHKPALQAACDRRLSKLHGDSPRWQSALERLPTLDITSSLLDQDRVTASTTTSTEQEELLRACLMELHPWRKGPFQIGNLHIDSEWQSDMKWQRLAPHLGSLEGESILDIGCGNGYYLWRMLGMGARLALGIDPTRLFLYQHQALKYYLGKDKPAHILPLGIEDLPEELSGFDTVFSMGVLYHRKDYLQHLQHLRQLIRPGGRIVLETLVIDSDSEEVLIPDGRYAQMRNVWAIPSLSTLESWTRKAGFSRTRIVDVTTTTIEEQRTTEWMRFQSLEDYLQPQDRSLTIEGYPAPCRAIVILDK